MEKNIKRMSFAALAALAMVSCSNHDDWMTYEEFMSAKYDAAFVQKYGNIDPNHTWGFGSATTRATRAAVPATNGNHNQNANEWADPDTEFGGWIVPDPLTEGQKERVRLYFQANPNLTYVDPQWEHFFVQQVYTGGTNPGPNSTEVVTAADGNTKYTGANMDKATVSQSDIYMNRFNDGTYNGGQGVDVLDNGQHVGGTTHKDQIMLMVNIDDTSCFGYDVDACEAHHNNRAALVSAAVIDAWAAENGNPGEPVTDKWDRSFLGYDLALNTNPRLPKYDYSAGVWPAPIIGYESFELDGETYYYLDTNQNMYYADDEEELYESMPQLLNDYLYALGNFSQEQQESIKKSVARMKELLAEGWLPVKDSKKIVKTTTGGADGYYSDWIITLCKANRIGEEDNNKDKVPGLTKGRIFCEDLGSTGDFDFNDVVFDAVINNDKSVDIKVWAAGGILDLEVAGVNVHSDEMLGAGMVNTGVTAGKRESADIHLTATEAETMGIETIEDIPVVVKKNVAAGYNEDILLKNTIGHAPQKICVPLDTRWVKEYKDISNAYKNFKDYVGNSSIGTEAFTTDIDESYLY